MTLWQHAIAVVAGGLTAIVVVLGSFAFLTLIGWWPR